MRLYGNAFSSDPGQCFRWVYEPSTSRPMRCPDQVVTRGWWRDTGGYWWALDPCPERASRLSRTRPRLGCKFVRSRPPFPTRRKPSKGGPVLKSAA